MLESFRVGKGLDLADSIKKIGAEVVACSLCPRLVAWRTEIGEKKRASFAEFDYWAKGVPGFGDPEAELVVIGLAPAAHGANRTGRMFTGDRSGDWLYRALHKAGFANQPTSVDIDDGLKLVNAYITSPVKCAPPANKPKPEETGNCKPFLVRELEQLKPKVIIVLGGYAFQAMCRHYEITPRPKFGHGVEVDLAGNSPGLGGTILCSYHVSQQNTFTGRLTEPMLDQIFERAAELIG